MLAQDVLVIRGWGFLGAGGAWSKGGAEMDTLMTTSLSIELPALS